MIKGILGGLIRDGINLLKIALFLPFLTLVPFIFIILYLISLTRKYYQPPKPNKQSVIIITGCDSGIGKATTLKLVQEGYHVIATVFTDEGGRMLEEKTKGMKGEVTFFQCDISSHQSVSSFREGVEELLEIDKSKKIVGLVNNAGIVLPGPIELQPIDQFQKQIDVNLLGHIRITQQFLGYIRKYRGRVVNICSIAGRISGPMMGSYNASKHAMEAVSDTLRVEMLRFGVSVSAIEPGFTKTPLLESVSGGKQQQIWDNLLDAGKSDYEVERQQFISATEKLNLFAGNVQYVADAVVHALTSSYPKTRYLTGVDANILAFFAWGFGDRVRDCVVKLSERF